jgi:hypothetical protein
MNTIEQRINQIEELPSKLEETVSGLTDEQLDTPYRDGGWTVRQVVHHLADSHMNAFIRMKLIVTEDHPTLRPYDQDDWAGLPDGRTGPIQSSLDILRGLHPRIAALLKSVKEEDFARTAYHPENGEMSLDRMLTIYSSHGEKHIGHIEGLKKTRGWK